MTDALRCRNCFAPSPAEPCERCGWHRGVPTPAPYLPVGTLLQGNYRIGRVLGHGGFGITYLGWDENLALKLAIKEYLPRDFATRTGNSGSVSVYTGEAHNWFDYGLDRFQDEARTLAKFQQHPGIVSVYNFFRANSTGYMVMEYVEGVTLKAFLEHRGPLPYEMARKTLLPVMDALRAVHAEGLLHRDVSPDNIYISFQKQVKLLDFGAARFAAGGHSRSLSVILKPGYAPEEQYRTHGKQGPWTDVYGLAATFYRCLTGVVPPEALDRLDQDSLKKPSDLGVEIPAAAERMLMAGLAVRANNRPQSMEAFEEVFLPGRVGDAGVSTSTAVPSNRSPLGSTPATETPASNPASPARSAKPTAKTAPSSLWSLGLILGGSVLLLTVPILLLQNDPARRSDAGNSGAKSETTARGEATGQTKPQADPTPQTKTRVEATPSQPRQGPVGTIAQEMVTIPGGEFVMGCSPGDAQCSDAEKPAHLVKTKAFRMGRYEVTQAQWQAVMGENPSQLKGYDRPVENVSWDDIQAFLQRLNANNAGKPYRLPTEAEWEYAARAGTTTPYWWGQEIGQGNANCKGCGSRSDSTQTAPVGSFRLNPFGLYDTAGSLWEWVQDCYHVTYQGAPTDGSEWRGNYQGKGTPRVIRGGASFHVPETLRSAFRNMYFADSRYSFIGFRLAQDL